MVNSRILAFTIFVLPIYALMDELVSFAMGRRFDTWDFASAIGGIALGIIVSIALAQHHLTADSCDSYNY